MRMRALWCVTIKMKEPRASINLFFFVVRSSAVSVVAFLLTISRVSNYIQNRALARAVAAAVTWARVCRLIYLFVTDTLGQFR